MASVKRVAEAQRRRGGRPRGGVRPLDRMEGVSLVAAECGVSRIWVWMVRTGRGKSERIAAALKAEGIPVEPMRRAR